MKKSILLYFSLIMMSFQIMAQSYDMVIKGGHLIDPINKIDQIMDVAISGNKIAAVEKRIPTEQAKKVVDASGLIVSPGLIDMHTHNFFGTVPKIVPCVLHGCGAPKGCSMMFHTNTTKNAPSRHSASVRNI